MEPLKVNNIRFHILHIVFILLLPTAILSFDFFQKRIPGNYYTITHNPLVVSENHSLESKAFNDPITDCSSYLDDCMYINKIDKKQLISYLLWDPTTGTGAPFFARWTTRVLSPFSIPLYFLPLLYALFTSIWLKIVIGGIGVYILALTFSLLPSTSLFTAIIFQTSGIFIFTPLHPTADVIAIAPYYLIILHLLSKENTILWIFLTFPIALMLLSGRLQPIIILLIFSFLYLTTVDLFSDKTYKQTIRKLLLLTTAWTLGTGLTLFQILPYIEWAKLKAYLPYEGISTFSIEDIFSFLLPITTNTEKENLILQKITASPTLLLLLLIPLYVSARNIIKNETQKYIKAFLIFSILILVFVFIISSELLPITDQIEFLRTITLMDTGWLFILALSLLIGLSLESWNLFNPDECRTCTKKLVIYAPIFWGIVFFTLLIIKLSFPITINNFWYYYIIGLLLLLVISIYFLVTLFSPSPTNGIYSMVVILLIFSHLFYSDYKPYIPYSTLTKFYDTCDQLKSFGNRVVTLGCSAYIPDSSDHINILPSPLSKRTKRINAFVEQANHDLKLWLRVGTNIFILPQSKDFNENFFKLRNKLKFASQFKSGLSIFDYEEPTNRAYVIYSWKKFTDSKYPEISSNLPHIVENIGNDMSGNYEPLPVETEDVSPTNIVLNVPKTKPGILVLADTYYPGWEATIDGKPTEIVPVNIAFRGVELSEGEHKIEMTYSCSSLYTGAILSVILLFIWLILAKFTLSFRK